MLRPGWGLEAQRHLLGVDDCLDIGQRGRSLQADEGSRPKRGTQAPAGEGPAETPSAPNRGRVKVIRWSQALESGALSSAFTLFWPSGSGQATPELWASDSLSRHGGERPSPPQA